MTLIAKVEGCGPLDQRPLSILPIVYRVWKVASCEQCNTWQEKRITEGQHGARVKHGTVDAFVIITGEMEYALLNGESLYDAALDLSKACDNIPQEITLNILRQMGLHWRILNPQVMMCGNLNRYFKIHGFLGKPFKARNSVMPGCTMSVLIPNALMGIFAHALWKKNFTRLLT